LWFSWGIYYSHLGVLEEVEKTLAEAEDVDLNSITDDQMIDEDDSAIDVEQILGAVAEAERVLKENPA